MYPIHIGFEKPPITNPSLFSQPAYLALFISIVAIVANVYIAYKNRQHLLAKEEYFKLQQVVEKIIAKLLILNNHQAKLKIFFEHSYKAAQDPFPIFKDLNDSLNKELFDKNGDEVAAMIDIYFPDLGDDWNFCLDKFSILLTAVINLDYKITNELNINWQEEKEFFNKVTTELGDKPKTIAGKLKENLVLFRNKNL